VVLGIAPERGPIAGDTPVTITQGRSVINGSGLIADNKTKQTTLLGPVRGVIHRDAGKTP
jgi:lipopolysaccharide export system protein LptC